MWNCTVPPSAVGICRITPRTCAVDWVSTIVFLISQYSKPVCMWCLGIPALTWFSRFCHVYSPKVFPTNRIILSNAFQWTCHTIRDVADLPVLVRICSVAPWSGPTTWVSAIVFLETCISVWMRSLRIPCLTGSPRLCYANLSCIIVAWTGSFAFVFNKTCSMIKFQKRIGCCLNLCSIAFWGVVMWFWRKN